MSETTITLQIFRRHGGVEAFWKPSLGIRKVLLQFNSERQFKKGLKVQADGGDLRPASKFSTRGKFQAPSTRVVYMPFHGWGNIRPVAVEVHAS